MKSSNYLRQAKRRNHHKDAEKSPSWQDKVVGKYQLSLLLDINRAQLDSWIKMGMPVIQEGGINREWEFDLVAVKAWANSNGHLENR